ncbi:MAG TPA: winged helix-turn-helix domain-containing protein [Terriglobia bacterium]|nr:winged helix-turn-helix domain-containing protein [Terriglobia bacterium]
MMDIKPQVGEIAGKVWELLSSDGPQTLAQLKKKVKGSGEVLGFAIGWLAREDQVEITAEKKTFRVQLK